MIKNNQEPDFGLPVVDSTPMNIVNMEGDMFRGITETGKHKSLFVRIASIFFCLFVLILPSLFYLGALLYSLIPGLSDASLGDYVWGGFLLLFVGAVLGFIVFAGIKGVLANIKK